MMMQGLANFKYTPTKQQEMH